MSRPEGERKIQRILVALDASPHSYSALEAAISVAVRMQAELQGLFVEDVVVCRLTESSSCQEIGLFTASKRQLDGEELSRQLRTRAVKVRRHFQILTDRAGLRGTFREARGQVSAEVLAAAVNADVVILGKGAWAAVDTGRLGPEVRKVLSRLRGSALILQAGSRLQLPMLVVYDGSPLADDALLTAASLAEKVSGGKITVLVLAEASDQAQKLRNLAGQKIEDRDLVVNYRSLSGAKLPWLISLIRREGYNLVVLPALRSVIEEEALMEFLDEIKTPVLLIQEGEYE